jgi:hypothetical protein
MVASREMGLKILVGFMLISVSVQSQAPVTRLMKLRLQCVEQLINFFTSSGLYAYFY